MWSYLKPLVMCMEDDAVCRCIAKVLIKHNVEFIHDVWEPTFFTLSMNNNELLIQAWHDAGSSTVKIPLKLLNPRLKASLLKCLKVENL